MFCKNCGAQLNDGTAFCTKCGAATTAQASSVNSQPQPVYAAQQPSSQPQQQVRQGGENPLAIIGFIFSFLFAIVGLICSILGYQKSKTGAPYGGLALAGIILSSIWIGLVFILIIV